MLFRALGVSVTQHAIERISPWRFRAPLSPDLAARREGRRIDVDDVIAFCQSAVEQRRDSLLIEGVGGIMVPLDDQRTILDVMMALHLPLILVAGSYLGTISHTLTALDSLYRRDMNVIGDHRQRDRRLDRAARRDRGGHLPLRRTGDCGCRGGDAQDGEPEAERRSAIRPCSIRRDGAAADS